MKDGEEDIVYAVDYNHKRERHLNGCVLESISRPALLITDAFNATYQQTRRRVRDEQLMTNILTTLRNNGNVLVSVDTAGKSDDAAYARPKIDPRKIFCLSGVYSTSRPSVRHARVDVLKNATSGQSKH